MGKVCMIGKTSQCFRQTTQNTNVAVMGSNKHEYSHKMGKEERFNGSKNGTTTQPHLTCSQKKQG